LVDRELRRLSNIFQDYGFTTKEWQIPTKNSHLDLMIKTAEFIRDADNDKNLFIVYYGGHGRINNERQAEWTCRRDLTSARVHWSAIQTLFAEAQSDVLILLDACAAASATARSLHGSMEAIMACGFESIAPPPGEHSFTNTLIDVLDDWIDRRSFSASCLHAEILSRLKLKENKKGREGEKLEWCRTPIHINCTQDSKTPSIELCRRNILPLPSSSAAEPEANHSGDAMDLDFDNSCSSPLSSVPSLTPSGRGPHVLISVALEKSQPDLDVKKTARWLESIPLLAKWTKVEAVFQSYSTLLILSVPIPIWNMLPDHPACSFVGYVTSPNLITPASTCTELESVPLPTKEPNTKKEFDDVEEKLSGEKSLPSPAYKPQQAIDALTRVLLEKGYYEDALLLHLSICNATRKAFGIDHPGVLSSMEYTMEILESQHRFHEAKGYCRAILRVQKKVFGPMHPDVRKFESHLELIREKQATAKGASRMPILSRSAH
jgi:hypothetical protein